MNVEMMYVAAVLATSGFVTVVAWWLWSDDLGLSGRLYVLVVGLHPPVGLLVVAELLAPTRSLSVRFYALHTALGLAIPLALFLFALSFTSHRRTPSRRLQAAVAAYVAVVAGLEVTNPVHSLARDSYRMTGETIPHVIGVPTTPYLLLTLPAFFAYYVAMGILGYRFLTRRDGRWQQTTVLFVGLLAPLVVSSLWFVGLLPGPINGAFVVGSSWMAAFAGWAVFRYQLFDVMPLAREAVFESLDERVVVVDRDHRLLDYNDSAATTFPDLVDNQGRPIRELMPSLVDADGASAADGGEATDGSAPSPSLFVATFTGYESGDPREYSVTVSELRADGRVQGYAVVVRDITDRQQRIRDLEQQKAQLERFASTLSHDIRNPLSVAQGRTELALAEDETAQLEHVTDALDRIEGIIEDLLTLSREGRTIDDRKLTSLTAVANDAWANTDTADATLDVAPVAGVSVYADRTRLLNVFENLFHNAVEHGGADVTVTVGRHDDGFHVADDGPGIPPADCDDVFDYEFTTGDGTGLGLAIVDAIARAHGWTVAASTGDDGGARIVFTGVDVVDDANEASTGSERDAATPGIGT
ncbi:ATP-binding protein [Haloplanus litoreus]|uniref:histidine kinase n=1 Tax=Haloplanus litoreus TaxID=767515 RepID=A0ABD5ZZ02_9EURY